MNLQSCFIRAGLQETAVKVMTFSFTTATVVLKHVVVAAALIDSASAFPIKP